MLPSETNRLFAECESWLAKASIRDAHAARRQLGFLRRDGSIQEDALQEKLRRQSEHLKKSADYVKARKDNLPHFSYPENLPISARQQEIMELIKRHQVIILSGATGSGKTTQIPKCCLDAGRGVFGKIACTQPRRVAAVSVSRRIAEELGVNWGEEVGCKIRFTDKTSPRTLIKMMTDGMLLAEVQTDRYLLEYDTIIVDEAHERSLNIDFLIGYLIKLRAKRPDLKIIVTSATIDTKRFSEAFDHAPVIEVSGRTYPVEIRYRPGDEKLEDTGDYTFIDAAVDAVCDLSKEFPEGDILTFMPTERDIRETMEMLQGRKLARTKILPLFGRLSNAEQEAIFKTGGQERRIVIATNIAETSVTIPNIRFVVDTGLARISRYQPEHRTLRLPIESISQSSCQQRSGRCGRVAEGVCIRLYSEEDFNKRPQFTQPEIQRCNLASVILQMKAFRLGDMDSFPFIEPPTPRAVQQGYAQLYELGALDAAREMTQVGHRLAKLPVDPSVARMLIEAQQRNVLREILVIGSALSIQDPRERPMDAREEADKIHKTFNHPDSDFLTLLAIWDKFHDACENLSQNKLRKFCHSHFLSYQRMREWRDMNKQLSLFFREYDASGDGSDLFRETGETDLKIIFGDSRFADIHRSILSGLPTNVAQKTDKQNVFHAANGKSVALFPGSGLYRKVIYDKRKVTDEAAAKKEKTKAPEWIVCGNFMETTQSYATTVAKLVPQWIVDCSGHLLKASYSNPQWEKKSQRVLVQKRLFLRGLEVDCTRVGYGSINPEDATEIFIRSALMEPDELEGNFAFLKHNQKVFAETENYQIRTRRLNVLALQDRLFEFYHERIRNVSSNHDLSRWLRQLSPADRDQLFITQDYLLAETDATVEVVYPKSVRIGQRLLPIRYNYDPDSQEDGAHLKLPVSDFQGISEGMLDWLVPGYVEERILALLKSLPKDIRVKLHPLQARARELFAELRPSAAALTEALTQVIAAKYSLRIPADAWKKESIPTHLSPRLSLVDDHGSILSSARDWNALNEAFIKLAENPGDLANANSKLWQKACDEWERYDLTGWHFGDKPESIEISRFNNIPVMAWIGLTVEEQEGRKNINHKELKERKDDRNSVNMNLHSSVSSAYHSVVHLKLFRIQEEAAYATADGWPALGEKVLEKQLLWIRKELKALRNLGTLLMPVGGFEAFEPHAWKQLCRYLFEEENRLPLRESVFLACLQRAKQKSAGIVPKFIKIIQDLLGKRQQLIAAKISYPHMAEDVKALISPDFLDTLAYEQLPDLLRYLEGIRLRAERYRNNPARDQENAGIFATVQTAFHATAKKHPTHPELPRLRWLLEEFRISLFAQEIGTTVRISQQKFLDELKGIEDGKSYATVKQDAAVKKPDAEKAQPDPTRKPNKNTSQKQVLSQDDLKKLFG